MNTIDKLFRDKLGSHSLPTPPSAWDAIGTARSAANSWHWSWAAAVTILVTLALGYYANKADDSMAPSQEQFSEVVKPTTPTALPPDKAVEINKAPRNIHDVDKKPDVAPAVEATFEAPPSSEVMNAEEIILEPAITNVDYTTVAKSKGIVIRYRLGPVNETMVVANHDEQNVSAGFEKALDAAREFKESDPYGRLRQAKDEIFAFNFLNSKKTTNEKHQ